MGDVQTALRTQLVSFRLSTGDLDRSVSPLSAGESTSPSERAAHAADLSSGPRVCAVHVRQRDIERRLGPGEVMGEHRQDDTEPQARERFDLDRTYLTYDKYMEKLRKT